MSTQDHNMHMQTLCACRRCAHADTAAMRVLDLSTATFVLLLLKGPTETTWQQEFASDDCFRGSLAMVMGKAWL